MRALLHVTLEHLCALRLVEADDLEDVRGVDPGVGAAAHHGHLCRCEREKQQQEPAAHAPSG
jgi:hypothetical protein